jgi:hypothetical protein
MPATKCPHCATEFETSESILEAVNFACRASSIQDPELVIGDFKLFFRGYVSSPNNIDLVGMCLARKEDRKEAGYIVVPKLGDAALKVQLLHYGEAIDVDWLNMPWEGILEQKDYLDTLVAAKSRAMKFLADYIKSLTAKEENTTGN